MGGAMDEEHGEEQGEVRVAALSTDEMYLARVAALTADDRAELRLLVDRLWASRSAATCADGWVGRADAPRGSEEPTALGDHVWELWALLFRLELVVPFDGGAWMDDDGFGRRRSASHLSLVDAVRYVTAVVRSDRFSPGMFAQAIDDGSLLDALGVVLRAGGRPTTLAS